MLHRIARAAHRFTTPSSSRARTHRTLPPPSTADQKKTQLEHILLRPDSYVGSVAKVTQLMWVLEAGASVASGGTGARIVSRLTTFVPGLYKIFDEILVNAADNKQRASGRGRARSVIRDLRGWRNCAISARAHVSHARVYLPPTTHPRLLLNHR